MENPPPRLTTHNNDRAAWEAAREEWFYQIMGRQMPASEDLRIAAWEDALHQHARAVQPWVDSDSWYRIGSEHFYNTRTGVVQRDPPSLFREDGTTRRRSAPSEGPWALPFGNSESARALPQGLLPPMGTDMLVPDCEIFGAGRTPVVFTAPHGVCVARDGKPDHLPEDFTTYLARAWAFHAEGTSVAWPATACAWVTRHEAPLPAARDPNYLTADEADANLWVAALAAASPTADGARSIRGERGEHISAHSIRGLHVDVHGKRDDHARECDCDIGVGAMRELAGDEAADALAAALRPALEGALEPAGFRVDGAPRLQGMWRTVPRRTLTQSAARLGYAAVQLELGYRLRRALGRNPALCKRVGDALASSVVACMHMRKTAMSSDPPDGV